MAQHVLTLAEVEAVMDRAQKATAGPWTDSHQHDDPQTRMIISGAESGRAVAVAVCPRYGHERWLSGDGEFLRSAREDVPNLVATIFYLVARCELAERRLNRWPLPLPLPAVEDGE